MLSLVLTANGGRAKVRGAVRAPRGLDRYRAKLALLGYRFGNHGLVDSAFDAINLSNDQKDRE
jgi:hypothetical protein